MHLASLDFSKILSEPDYKSRSKQGFGKEIHMEYSDIHWHSDTFQAVWCNNLESFHGIRIQVNIGIVKTGSSLM